MTQKGSVQEINRCELNALIKRVEHAIEYDLALSVDDLKLLLSAITTLCELQSKMEQDDVTLSKLRKLLGMVKQSESRNNTGEKANKGKSGKGTRPNSKPKFRKNNITVVIHRMTAYQKGDVCPHCKRGKLYKHTPGVLLRITGHAPYEAIKHITEQYRCNACQDVFKATLPEEVLADGDAEQQYGFSARALMALSKFYTGTPYHHQSNFSSVLGLGIGSSTIFDQCQHVANSVEPVFCELQKQAANANLMDIDDTRNRILASQPELRKKRNSEKEHLRSGVYTSGLVATLDDGHEIILFETSLGHAGEHLDHILAKRFSYLGPPIVMSDALSSNTSLHKVIHSNCNAHCRRLFYDLQEKLPKEIEWLLDTYGKIWKNDADVREDSPTPKKRLDYHKAHSLPVMEELKSWAETQIAHPEFEEHSAFVGGF